MESRTDDDLLIGKMQRQLMSTKASYKLFSRKYQLLRGNMRQVYIVLYIINDCRIVVVCMLFEPISHLVYKKYIILKKYLFD